MTSAAKIGIFHIISHIQTLSQITVVLNTKKNFKLVLSCDALVILPSISIINMQYE